MDINTANKILKDNLKTDKWYFEERRFITVFLEKLSNTYNHIFTVTLPTGEYTRDIYDFHVRQALSFVRRRRKPQNKAFFDKKSKVYSGERFYGDDPINNYRHPDTQ